jgi:hypothetical protein
MDLQIVNPRPQYAPPAQATPPEAGYLHIGGSVSPPAGPPFVRPQRGRSALLRRCARLAGELERLAPVERVAVYRAVLVPPLGANTAAPARFDVAVLIEASGPELLEEVRASPPYGQMLAAIEAAASDVAVMSARCHRSLGRVDQTRQGLFLFNHFATTAETGIEVATSVWEHLAGWYVAETGLDNSTLLAPLDAAGAQARYMFVNHARWDKPWPRLAAEQFGRPSFHSYVRANLAAHGMVAMPVLYRLAWPGGGADHERRG